MDNEHKSQDANAPAHNLDTPVAPTPSPGPPGLAPEMASMVSHLADSVQTMQGHLGSAYQTLANNMKQSLEMTQAMSNMMEMLLASNLNICSRIERDERSDKPLLVITTENKSQLPIPHIVGLLKIGRDDNQERTFETSEQSKWTLVSSAQTISKRVAEDKDSSIYELKSGPSGPINDAEQMYGSQINSVPLVLLPDSRWTDVFELELEQFDSWVIVIETSFQSPGSNRRFRKKHECCIYLMDQCVISWEPGTPKPTTDPVGDVTMRTANFRQTLQVPLTEGLRVGMTFTLVPSQATHLVVYGEVTKITDDHQETTCALWLDDVENQTRIIDRIRRELEVLGSL